MLPEDYLQEGDTGSIGRAANEVEVRIIEPGGDVCATVPTGQLGELIIRGPSVACEIWNRPDLTEKAFSDGWWRSGDLASMDENGFIILGDRADDMIISGGINVLPGEIEEILLAHPQVAECAVVGLPHDDWGQEITAVVVLSGAATQESLANYIKSSELAGYKQPRRFVFADELPKGVTGKVSKKLVKRSLFPNI